MDEKRAAARAMAAEAVGRGEPTAWFEELYAAADRGEASVPWADLEVNPHLASWDLAVVPPGARVLVVGCGLGDDAEWLAGHGFHVTAFDISATAVAACRERFPGSTVDYVVADLLDLPDWEPFDLVVEVYTIQVLPPGSRERAAAYAALASVTGGLLLVIARGREEDEDPGSMPWPLTRAELGAFGAHGLREVALEDYLDDEEPPVRRLRAVFARA